ncbi:uncharacterized protein LOC129597976 [Paramacrobiotus metropolitanus]|uniref:uncharacterized protein LOC129597976 n=1 Tax=Paramacrobiotus metropolitanus TaxID=2943436 RepID=UPI002445C5F9|nr:uncharacterized protein LOC129597976 [Paramacrobiotus metropolitanus]
MPLKISAFLATSLLVGLSYAALIPSRDGSSWEEDFLENGAIADDRPDFLIDEAELFGVALSPIWNVNDVYAACGTTRACIGDSDSCVSGKSCEFLLSYGAAGGDNKIPVELYGKSPKSKYSTKFWVGFGVNLSGKMTNAAVVQCARYPDGSGEVVAAYTSGKHSYHTLDNRQLGISNITVTSEDDYQHCSFDLDVQRTVDGTVYDLEKAYHILVGSGKVKDDDDWDEVDDEDHYVYHHCNRTRQCYGVPAGCIEAKNCSQLISYGVQHNHRIPVDLYGTAPNATYKKDFWVGFGASQSGGMDLSAVVQCAHYSDGKSDVVAAFNAPQHNYEPLTRKHEGIHHIRTHFKNGFVRCAFELNVERNVSGMLFDLRQPYYLLLGSGWINETARHKYDLKWHLEKPFISSQKIVFACGNKCKPTETFILSNVYADCGTTRKCIGVPDGCVDQKNCLQLLSYGAAAHKHSRTIPVDIFGAPPNATYADNFWVGFGASESGGMDYTAVVQCAQYSNGTVDVVTAYNAKDHKYVSLPHHHAGIKNITTTKYDGYVQCSFHLDIRRKVAHDVYNLHKPYYLLLGSGWINQTATNTYELKWHLQKPAISKDKIVMACGNKCGDNEPEIADVYDDCGNSRQCYGVPTGCVDSKNCLQLLSYSNLNTGTNTLDVDLYGTAPNSTYQNDFWVGFGTSQSGGMDLTAVVQCAQFSNGNSDVVAAYNAPMHSYQPLPDRHNGISQISTRFAGGFVHCAFKLDVTRNVAGNSYDLRKAYYLLLGSGWINETAPSTYELKWHLSKPYATKDKIVMACGKHCRNRRSSAEEEVAELPSFDDLYAKCGKAHKCQGVPEGCVEKKNCQQLLAYQAALNGQIPMWLYGFPYNATYKDDFWIGFGASISGGMDKTAVVQCAHYSNGTNDIVAAYNAPDHEYQPLTERYIGITHRHALLVDGALQCSFHLDVQRSINGTTYDLNTPYTLLLGTGWINETMPNEYQLMWHWQKPQITPNVTFACGNYCPSPTTGFPAVYDQCGKSRRCFGVPAGCLNTGNCLQLLSYGSSDNSTKIPVDLYGVNNDPKVHQYWVGFGTSISGKMESSAVVQCMNYGNGSSGILAGYNSHGTDGHQYDVLVNTRLGISEFSSAVLDGYVQCSFNLDVTRTISNVVFDLRTPYTILLGSGSITGAGNPDYHETIPTIFSPKVVMACGNRCPPSACTGQNCFGVPEGCEETGNCQALLAWSAVPNGEPTSAGVIQVGLYGRVPDRGNASAFWIGFGVTHTKNMSNAAVVQCVKRPDDKDNEVLAAYNGNGRQYDVLPDKLYGIHNSSVSMTDGEIGCTFQLDIVREISNETFDLRDYMHILLGSGGLRERNGTLLPGKHLSRPRISANEVALACAKDNCSTTQPPTVPTTPPLTTVAPTNSTGKFVFPKDCETTDTCTIVATFQTDPDDNGKVAVTLEGKADAGQETFWFALGVAPGMSMANAMVLECVVWRSNASMPAQPGVFTSYNSDDHKNFPTAMNGVMATSMKAVDGKFTCSMTVDVVRTVFWNDKNATFDLNTPYYLLLAKGSVTNDHTKDYHQDKRVWSTVTVVVNSTSGGDIPVARTTNALKKTHAILMVLAWNFCAAMGMFFARHTKDMWPDTQPFKVKLWFTIHRVHMVSAVVLSITAVVIIFVDKQQWLDVPHAYTGIITFALAFVQPIIATFRPHPGTPNRKYFNWIHWSIGYGALLLAGVTMALGTLLDALDIDPVATWIVVGAYAYNALLQLILEIHKAGQANKKRRESREHLAKTDDKPEKVEPVIEPLEPDDMVRKVILGLTWLGLFGDTIAVIVFIAIA